MSLEERKRAVLDLSDEEHLHLRFFLKHTIRKDSAENHAELSRIHRAMDSGEYVTLEPLREMCAALEAEGL